MTGQAIPQTRTVMEAGSILREAIESVRGLYGRAVAAGLSSRTTQTVGGHDDCTLPDG